MSRKSKQRRDKKQRKQVVKSFQTRKPLSRRAEQTLDAASDLIEDGDLDSARELLETFNRQHHGHAEAQQMLLDIYHDLRDYDAYTTLAQQMLARDPRSRSLHLMVAGGWLATDRPVSGYQAFKDFLTRWPDDPMSDGVREEVARMEPIINKMLDESEFPPADRIELATYHEEALWALQQNDLPQVIGYCEKLLAKQPHFIPAMNNVTEAYFRTGQFDQAFAMSRRALAQDPGNVHASANLTRHLFLAGHFDEAMKQSEPLRQLPLDTIDACCKAAETFSFLGDDEGVHSAFRCAELLGGLKNKWPTVGLLYHLAAVAHARKDDWNTAKRYWQKALERYPSLEVARANLDDLASPVGRRHAPWSYDVSYWVRRDTTLQLAMSMSSAGADQSETKKAQQFAAAHPEVVALIPAMLDRADRGGRELAILLAKRLGTAETMKALRDFCLSDRGPDDLRSGVAHYLRSRGEVPAESVRMSVKGEWRNIRLASFEVTDEPNVKSHSDEVHDLSADAMDALCDGDGVTAERLLKAALKIEPDAPDLLNNLGLAYECQGKHDQVVALIHEIHERWPDYFFGRIGVANLLISEEQAGAARELIGPLLEQTRFHHTEFAALCNCHIRLLVAEDNLEAAKSWMELWQRLQPEAPEIAPIEKLLKLAEKTEKIGTLLSGSWWRR